MKINTTCGLFVMNLETEFYWCLQLKWFYYIRCNITLSFLIYSAGRYLFHELCLPWYSVHHSLPPVRKCSNVTDQYEIPDFWLQNSPEQNIVHYKIWGSESTRKKHRMWTILGGIGQMHEFQWNRALFTMALISGIDVSVPAFEPEEDILNIHCDTN